MQTWLICLIAIGSNQSGLWTNSSTWQDSSIPTFSDKVAINTGHTVTIPNGQTVQAGTLFNQGILQNFGTLQMGTLVGNVSGTLQSVDYSYYIRGLKGINLDANNNLTNKLFSMKLGYEETGYYDGNIGKQEWKSSLDGLTRAYTYNYDGANRILSGTYTGGKPNENYSLNSVVYDGNGNITNLSRNGFKSNNTFGLIDNLSYNYPNGSNKIQAVTDISNETASFTDVVGSTDYTYYPDGSLKSDANKGITLIEYNYLKLPKRIVKGSTTILYQYDASGKKLKETIGTNVTDYVGNLIYKNNGGGQPLLYQIGHDEGRIVDGQYEYNIKDHLGNLRVAFRDSSGIAKIVQANSYGVWGEDLPTLSYLKSSWKVDNFTFQGKEFETQTGQYDFGTRMYDPIIGRWGVMDFKAELMPSHSPLSFCFNNPLRFTDPDGQVPGDLYDQKGNKVGTDNVNDGRNFVVTDKQTVKDLKKSGGTVADAGVVNSAVLLPSNATLQEASNVIDRTEANGGFKEENSIVMKSGQAIQGSTGPMPTIINGEQVANATLPNLPAGSTMANVEATIHSHPTQVQIDNNMAYPQSATLPSPTDKNTFKNYGTNIIVGRLGQSSVSQNPNGSYAVSHQPLGAVIYNNNTQPQIQLTQKAIQKILKTN